MDGLVFDLTSEGLCVLVSAHHFKAFVGFRGVELGTTSQQALKCSCGTRSLQLAFGINQTLGCLAQAQTPKRSHHPGAATWEFVGGLNAILLSGRDCLEQ